MKFLTRAAAALALILSAGSLSAADVTEHQWVRAVEGAVKGRVVVPRGDNISAVRGAKVSLIDQFGKYAAKDVESDNTGRFMLENVRPGVYSLMIEGEHEFACCAMHVVDSGVPLKSEFEIAAGSVDMTIVRNAMVRYLPAGESKNKVVFDPATNPMGSDRAMTGDSIRIRQYEGGLKGRLTRAGFTENLGAGESNVIIYRDGVEVARTMTGGDGGFLVSELAPGSYTIVGSGPDGFGVMGFELVDPLAVETAAAHTDDRTLVSMAMLHDEFLMQVAPVGTIISDRVISEQIVDSRVIDDRIVGAPILDGGMTVNSGGGFVSGGGGVGGGGGGIGGGGIGGGGGLGRLGLLGGIGAAIAIAASDDDGNVTPPVASPATPAN